MILGLIEDVVRPSVVAPDQSYLDWVPITDSVKYIREQILLASDRLGK